ncbi:sensor histidine kinase [Planobispora takensis]|uniref:histidine kinase n=1 Tax=Planobispora takensis TaxID=1367882 RepID=A0A8J3T5I5_9ACTN|nr:histidine kinase [Planobispora takensis]GII06088.1 histidine kinase [Planobispora takensis]
MTSPVTYLRWTCLILGGALAMPYVMAGSVIDGLLRLPDPAGYPLLTRDPLIFSAMLPVIVLTGLFLPVRGLELTAARGLLGAAVDSPPPAGRRTWAERGRTAAWFTLHLTVGAVVAGVTLAVVPFAIWLCVLPVYGDPFGLMDAGFEAGWTTAWAPPAAMATLLLLIHAVSYAGALLARLAPALLGPSPADRLAVLEERTRRLAERNRLARELHDSVGHALSVVTLQAGAAGKVLERDPQAARAALTAIEESARAALEDLDHVLGVLRAQDDDRRVQTADRRTHDDGHVRTADRRTYDGGCEWGGGERAPADPPARTLADLPGLLRATGAQAEVSGDLDAVPALVSREAYRIAQEALTNAVRHGGRPVRLAAAVRDGHLELQVRNPVRDRPRRPGTGRGVDGMRERVALLGGRFEAGAAGGRWQVTVRLPLRVPAAGGNRPP